MTDLPKLTNDYVIDKLSVQPVGEHQWVNRPGDPDQYNMYISDTHILLLRSHILGVSDGPDAFEVILLTNPDQDVLFHEDVLEEDMNKDSILDAVRLFNEGKNV